MIKFTQKIISILRLKRTVVILFVISFLLETSGLKELVKTPFLLHHYTEYAANHPNDNFINFITKHYTAQQPIESEHDRKTDAQLPFKSSDCYQAHISPFIVSLFMVIPVIFDIHSADFAIYTAPDVISRSFDIWQPPKII